MSGPVNPSDIWISDGPDGHDVPEFRHPDTHFGAVIVFKQGTTLDEAEKMLQLMRKKILDHEFEPEVKGFNPFYGKPYMRQQ